MTQHCSISASVSTVG